MCSRLINLRSALAVVASVYLAGCQVQAASTFRMLFGFDGTNGAWPFGLVRAQNGDIYGGTVTGGFKTNNNSGLGTLFKLSPDGVLTTLLQFGDSNGSVPIGIVAGTDGNYYGTTSQGGSQGWGSFYRLSPSGSFTSLCSFARATGSEAGMPTQGADGAFYGTTFSGGETFYGSVFKVTTNGTLTMLVSFNGTNGASAYGFPLIEDVAGNLYGTTTRGGPSYQQMNPGGGVIFKISPQGKFDILYSFDSTNDASPRCLAWGDNGDMYGMTYTGAAHPLGAVFRFSTNGTLSIAHVFAGGSEGAHPSSNLIRARNGNFYGATESGGAYGQGTVFELTPGGGFTTLHSFNASTDGGDPGWLVEGQDGKLYGTTKNGGPNGNNIAGTVFSLTIPVPPALPPQLDRAISDLEPLVVTNTATSPNGNLSYVLLSPPAGAQIDTNGVITWTPTLAESPSTNMITTAVVDGSVPPLGATNAFTVVVSGPYDGIDLTEPAQAQADLDGDGLVNLVEFALGTDPRSVQLGQNALLVGNEAGAQGEYLTLQFKRRTQATELNIQYVPEVSGDGHTWFSDSAHLIEVSASPLDSQFDWVVVRDQTTLSPSAPRYIRLRVIEN